MRKASCVAVHIMNNTYANVFVYDIHGVHVLKHVCCFIMLSTCKSVNVLVVIYNMLWAK